MEFFAEDKYLEERLRQEILETHREFDAASEKLKSFAWSPHYSHSLDVETKLKYEVAYRRYSSGSARIYRFCGEWKSPTDSASDGTSRCIP